MNVLNLIEIIGTIALCGRRCFGRDTKTFGCFWCIYVGPHHCSGGRNCSRYFNWITPPTAFLFPMSAIISLITAIITCFAYGWLTKLTHVILVCDAIGLEPLQQQVQICHLPMSIIDYF